MKKNESLGIFTLRVSLGVLMLLHGIAKIQKGVGGIAGMMEQSGLPSFFANGVYVGEVIAPILLIVGFRTRIASIFFAGTMVVAVVIAHGSDIVKLTQSGGWAIELQALYFFGTVTLFFTGGGKYALSNNNRWD
ncbi:MAG: DoxX family protein [Fulvivirga sp.]